MPDRSLRPITLPQRSAQPGKSSAVLLRERPSSPPDGGGGKRGEAPVQDDNPFAAPPEGSPDSPWQPRHPSGDEGSQGQGGQGQGGGRSPWGRGWSDRQPGRSSGGFGERPGSSGGSGPEGQGGGQGPRWDPTDPAQRRARYALLCGMWALFFALFDWPYVALPLGSLALYWGIASLRAKPRAADPDAKTPAQPTDGRPQRTAAITGLVTSSLAVLLVFGTFATQLVYRDFYTCKNDALTNEAQQSCNRHLPEQLRGVLGTES
ncbi:MULTISPECIES: hypothetical protein [unclassified Streptomyces]|uniref:hypothetical protein n=1 Tax=unclassified Streptomyces TaxID=2593676 RepID=UPI00223880CD|nr:hypothetical protein [Streptomyces sp. SHP 1-2]MCW5251581.1 hypothetical protein [Streptomyces sp. SHP 1-2]